MYTLQEYIIVLKSIMDRMLRLFQANLLLELLRIYFGSAE